MAKTKKEIPAAPKEIEIVTSKGLKKYFADFLSSICKAIKVMTIKLITLKETGKWVSLVVLFAVLKMFHTFLWNNNYSIEAMTTVAPYLGQTITWVFGIIAGAKTIQGTAEKILEKFGGGSVSDGEAKG